jgi:molybdopterin-guanine dinucleotide biosynthesis protein A
MGSSTAVVLAGGTSTRFGSDKTAALLDGVTLLDRVVDVAIAVADEVLVVGPRAPGATWSTRSEPEASMSLAEVAEDVRRVLEPEPRRGPLGGFAHGLAHVDSPVVLLLAADHPYLQPELLRSLLERLVDADGGVDAVVPMRDGRPEPLVAAYRTDVGPVAEQVLADGGRSMRTLLDRLRVDWWAEDEWRRVDPTGSSFDDVDEPGDLDRRR